MYIQNASLDRRENKEVASLQFHFVEAIGEMEKALACICISYLLRVLARDVVEQYRRRRKDQS
jgi:hypothetical protein